MNSRAPFSNNLPPTQHFRALFSNNFPPTLLTISFSLPLSAYPLLCSFPGTSLKPLLSSSYMLMQVKALPAVFPVTTSITPKCIISSLHLYSESVSILWLLMGLFTSLATSYLKIKFTTTHFPSNEFQIQFPLNQLFL